MVSRITKTTFKQILFCSEISKVFFLDFIKAFDCVLCVDLRKSFALAQVFCFRKNVEFPKIGCQDSINAVYTRSVMYADSLRFRLQ